MIKPSVDELSMNKYNRYVLCIVTSKCARSITEAGGTSEANGKDYVASGEKNKANYESKPLIAAINKIYNKEYTIRLPEGIIK